jgi:drug/metabolite transporter (DMT)-like permease
MANDQSAPRPVVPPVLTPEQAKAKARYIRTGYVFAAVGALLFSTKAVVIKLAYEEPIDAETLLALRMLFALPIYLAIGWLSVRSHRATGTPLPPRRVVVNAALIGLLGYWVASYLDFLGLEYISAQFERLILFTYPLFVVILGALFFRQPISLRVVGAILISYAGLALIFAGAVAGDRHATSIGAGLVLACAVAFALYQLLARSPIAAMGPRLFTCVAMSAAAFGALAQFLLTHPPSALLVSDRLLVLSFVIAIGATVLPTFFLNAALHRISAQANATIGTLSPVMTIILAVIILGEPLTLANVAGAALVLAGVGWFTFADVAARRRKPE